MKCCMDINRVERDIMDNLYLESIIERISVNLDMALEQINGKKVAIYNIDEYSFAIQSLLKNRRKSADMYLSFNKTAIVSAKRRISGISARYLKSNDNLIEINSFDETDSKDIVLLAASKINKNDIYHLERQGYVVNKNLFVLYDWTKDLFSNYVREKKELTLEELQNLEKQILKEFDEYCIESGLRYWVCGGTLLGTIRHKGFIPWDDDIDVFMPWEDYQKFVRDYEDNNQYRVACMDKQEYVGKYKTIWGKMVENTTIIREVGALIHEIHPAWIDIFPIIGMPADEKGRNDLLEEVVEAERKFTENLYRSNGNIRQRNQAYTYIVNISKRYDFDKSQYVGVIGTQYREKDIVTRAVFNDTLRMPFEDIEVNVPIGYKEYLNNLYGYKWMEIPGESKRNSHNIEAYWM